MTFFALADCSPKLTKSCTPCTYFLLVTYVTPVEHVFVMSDILITNVTDKPLTVSKWWQFVSKHSQNGRCHIEVWTFGGGGVFSHNVAKGDL